MTDCIPSQISPNTPQQISDLVLPEGFLSLRAVNEFQSDFERAYVSRGTENEEFGSKSITSVTKEINDILPIYNTSITERYPALNTRLINPRNITTIPSRGTNIKSISVFSSLLLPIEVSNFMQAYSYTPTTFSTSLTQNPLPILGQLDSFYGRGFELESLNTFCAVVPTIFAAVDNFFDRIEDFVGISAEDLLESGIAGAVKQLKEQLFKTIERTINSVKSAIENFSVSNLVAGVSTIINNAVIKNLLAIRERLLAIFSQDNIEALKAKIGRMIDYVTNLFENPTFEDIQYIIYRFCQFAGIIQQQIYQLQQPFTSAVERYDSTYEVLKASSNQNTARAIRAGALRSAGDSRASSINILNNQIQRAGNPRDLLPADYENITPWNNGAGDSRISFQGRWVSKLKEEGWLGVNLDVRARLMLVQEEFGRQLIVNSGYRPKWYNDGLRGAAKTSQHLYGNAVDITWSGFSTSSREQFIDIAKQMGFRGIGRYGTFAHIDIGRSREWSG